MLDDRALDAAFRTLARVSGDVAGALSRRRVGRAGLLGWAERLRRVAAEFERLAGIL